MSLPTERLRAPELVGGGAWSVVDQPLTLAQLRGRIVIVWFFCPSSESSIRVWDELQDLQTTFVGALNVVGVYVPKFDAERLPGAVDAAVQRLGITVPVVDDSAKALIQAYGVRGWPACVLIDTHGFVVAGVSGEGVIDELAAPIQRLIDAAQVIGATRADPIVRSSESARVRPTSPTQFRFPRDVAANDELASIAIADTGNDRVIVCGPGGAVTHTFGDLNSPSGVAFDGGQIIVADTGADRVVAIELSTGARTVLAADIASPRGVAVVSPGVYVVSETARHRLCKVDVRTHEAGVIAGTGAEDLIDSRSDSALLAQPMGLARIDGGVVFVDSSSSSLRKLDSTGRVTTMAGRGLYDWGDADGTATAAAMQYPTGVAVGRKGEIYVADTYNNLIRVYDNGRISTLGVGGLSQPSGLAILADGTLLIADTGNSRIVMANRDQAVQVEFVPSTDGVSADPPQLESFRDPDEIRRVAAQLELDAVLVRSGQRLRISWNVALGEGEYLDAAAPDAVVITVWAEPGAILAPGARSWAVGDVRGHIMIGVRSGAGNVYAEVVARIIAGSRVVTRSQLRKIALRVD